LVDLERQAKLQTVGTALGLIVLVAVGAWLLGKFIAADDNSQSEATPTTATSPIDPEAEVKAEIEDAYRAYLAMEERLLLAPNPDDPEIPERATGPALEHFKKALARDIEKGQIIRVGPTSSQTILSIEVTGDQATLRACFVDESGLFDAATGDEIEPMHTGTEIDTTVLVRDGERWRVSERRAPAEGEVWDGVSTCEQ
jgi:hypothetical protein